MLRNIAVVIVVLGLGCSRGPAPEPEPAGPELAKPTPGPSAAAAPDPNPSLSTSASTPAPTSKEAVAALILPSDRLQGWTVRLAYDLGSVKLAVIDRPDEPQALSLVRATAPAAAPAADFERAFAGESFEDREHPLELLGYDLVQVTETSAPGERLLEARYGWMRQGEDGELERGSGSALWLRCPGDGTILLVSGEGPSETYAPAAARAFARSAHRCGER